MYKYFHLQATFRWSINRYRKETFVVVAVFFVCLFCFVLFYVVCVCFFVCFEFVFAWKGRKSANIFICRLHFVDLSIVIEKRRVFCFVFCFCLFILFCFLLLCVCFFCVLRIWSVTNMAIRLVCCNWHLSPSICVRHYLFWKRCRCS